jgi:tetratricopeptide (TPR) repeat protein
MGADSISIRRMGSPGAPDPPSRALGRRPALVVPGLLVLVIAGGLALFDGGYTRTVWHTVGLFLLALTVLVLLVAPPSPSERSRPVELALAAFGLFTAWSFVSILWADTPGDAWEGANRTLVYWLGIMLVAQRPWPVRAVRWALMVVAFGLTALAIGMVVALATSDEPAKLLLDGRLSEPIGYANATANLWMIALWPALHLAIARDVRWPVRGLALGSATVLLQVALLSQSRGAAAAFIVTAVAFVLLHPRHWSALLALGVTVGLMALGWDELTSVRNADDVAALGAAIDESRSTIILSAVLAALAGAIGAFAEGLALRRATPDRRRERLAERSFLALAAVGAIVLVVVVSSSTAWIEDRWDDFRSGGYAAVEDDDNRFTGALGSNRYDFYRVAWNEFADHPITGIGTENFAVPYLEQRRSGEAPRYPHSLAFSLLAMLGIVGTLLFAVFVALALAPSLRQRLRGTPTERGLVVACVVGFLAWLTHAMVDWLWEYPALTLLALGLLVVAARAVPDTRDELERSMSGAPLRSLGVRAVIGLLAVAAAASLALPGASARYEAAAFRAGVAPQTALDRLERAANLDPLAADPLIGRAVLARRIGRPGAARADLQEAVDREAKNWFAWFELALFEAQQRRWAASDRAIRRAKGLNPRQPLLDDAARSIARRQRVDPLAYERALTGQLSQRLQPFG